MATNFILWISSHFILTELRKFTEQYGDIIQWDQLNRAYIMTHAVPGVEWAHYKHPLSEYVYDMHMRYWKHTALNAPSSKNLPHMSLLLRRLKTLEVKRGALMLNSQWL